MNPALYSVYTIHDIGQFMENWQDVVDEEGLTFWFGFKNGSYLHKSGDLDSVVKTWSNHVGATVYVHYFKCLDAYRIGQIYDGEIALQVSEAVFILKHDPILHSIQLESLPSTNNQDVEEFPLVPPHTPNLTSDTIYNATHSHCSQHIRKPRNAWIIFRQEMMLKYRDQIGHLHTSEQSKVISQMWKKTPRPMKDFYTRRSHKEKADLLARHPDYKVQPRKSSDIKKRVKNKYPTDMTVEKLNQFILDGQVQVQTAFSGESPRVTCFTISDSACSDGLNNTTNCQIDCQTELECQVTTAIASVDSLVAEKEAEIQAQVSMAMP